jgi:hypothetical protein
MDQLRLVRVMASLTSHAVPNENRPPAASVAGVSPLKLSGGGAGGGPSSSQIMSQQLTCHLSEDTSVMAASEGVAGTGYYVVSYQVDTVGYYNILVTTTHSESSSFKNVGLGFSPAAYTRRDNQLHSPGRIAFWPFWDGGDFVKHFGFISCLAPPRPACGCGPMGGDQATTLGGAEAPNRWCRPWGRHVGPAVRPLVAVGLRLATSLLPCTRCGLCTHAMFSRRPDSATLLVRVSSTPSTHA